MKMKKMKRYQEGGSTSVEVEKRSSILDDLGVKGLPLGIVGQGLISALEKGDVGGQGLLGLLMDRKKKRQAGMPGTPEDGSITKIEIEKSRGMEPMESKVGGRMPRYAEGGSLKMVEKNGEKVPFFAADNKGKMAGGGMLGYKKGGRIDGCAIKGKTKGTYR